MTRQMILYLIISYSFIVYAWYLTSYGVLLPYYSQQTGHDETYYSFMFIVRSSAFIFGSFSVKYFVRYYSTQTMYIIYTCIISVSLFLCSLSLSWINLTIMLFLSGFSFISWSVIGISLIIKLFEKNKPEFWVILTGVFFGIGATCSPLFTIWLELSTYKVMSIASALIIPMLLWKPFPNLEEQKEGEIQNKKIISSKTQIYICIIMLMFPAQEVGFASWLPTYSIKAGISDTSNAAVYSLYFWLPNTIARLFWSFLARCTVTYRLKIVEITVTITSVLLFVLQYLEFYQLVCIIGPIVFGFMLSCVYSFCVTLPLDNGYDNTISNSANFMLANCIGEGLLNAPIGYSMNLFGFQSLMIIIMISCFISFWSFQKAVSSFSDVKPEEEGQEMNLLQSRDL